MRSNLAISNFRFCLMNVRSQTNTSNELLSCIRNQQFKKCVRLFESQKLPEGQDKSEWMLPAMLAYSHLQMPNKVVELSAHLRDEFPKQTSYLIVKAFCKAGKLDVVEAIWFDSMLKSDMKIENSAFKSYFHSRFGEEFRVKATKTLQTIDSTIPLLSWSSWCDICEMYAKRGAHQQSLMILQYLEAQNSVSGTLVDGSSQTTTSADMISSSSSHLAMPLETALDITHTMTLKALCDNHQYEKALNIFCQRVDKLSKGSTADWLKTLTVFVRSMSHWQDSVAFAIFQFF